MSQWSEFEDKILIYLRRRFNLDGIIHFIKSGESNSTTLDIKACGTNNGILLIEVKSPNAHFNETTFFKIKKLFYKI